MEAAEAFRTLQQLRSYTIDVAKLLGAKVSGRHQNHYGDFGSGMPIGAITHYTASNAAFSKRRPYGRLPNLLNRFAPNSDQGVGVQFVIVDQKFSRFDEMRDKYETLRDMPGEVMCFGHDKAFFHAGWANRWAYGIEIRNCGRLYKSKGNFFWGTVGKYKYNGRTPLTIAGTYWEPYTYQQMAATLWVHRLMYTLYPQIRPERFLGHVHVSNTRIDPGLHFPIHEMRDYTMFKPKADVPLIDVPFLKEFSDDPEFDKREHDPLVSEQALSAGLYRHDWDGFPDGWDGLPDDEEVVDRQGAIGQLRALGYYVPVGDPIVLNDVVKTFQARWKKRDPQTRKFVPVMKVTGQLDDMTLAKLREMVNLVAHS